MVIIVTSGTIPGSMGRRNGQAPILGLIPQRAIRYRHPRCALPRRPSSSLPTPVYLNDRLSGGNSGLPHETI